MVDNAGDNGGPQGRPLPHTQTDKQLGGVEDDGVDACPLLEEGTGSRQDQLRPVLARQDSFPRVLNLHM